MRAQEGLAVGRVGVTFPLRVPRWRYCVGVGEGEDESAVVILVCAALPRNGSEASEQEPILGLDDGERASLGIALFVEIVGLESISRGFVQQFESLMRDPCCYSVFEVRRKEGPSLELRSAKAFINYHKLS